MNSASMMERMEQVGVVPVIAIDSTEAALPLADALIEAGLPVAEITFRTEAAADVIALLSQERPNLFLGAGTVLTAEHVRRAKECGAQFAVAPGLNPGVVREAQRANLPFFPGVMTPSEIEEAVSLGVKALKFFPAEAAGGARMLKALAAPYAHVGVKFLPTGGISLDNLGQYLSLPTVFAVGGTWIARRDSIADARWDEVKRNAESAVRLVEQIRS